MGEREEQKAQEDITAQNAGQNAGEQETPNQPSLFPYDPASERWIPTPKREDEGSFIYPAPFTLSPKAVLWEQVRELLEFRYKQVLRERRQRRRAARQGGNDQLPGPNNPSSAK